MFFSHAINLLCKKATKAIFYIRKQLTSDNLNVLQNLKLFQTRISLILLFCSELLCLDTVIREGTEIEHRYSSFFPEKI